MIDPPYMRQQLEYYNSSYDEEEDIDIPVGNNEVFGKKKLSVNLRKQKTKTSARGKEKVDLVTPQKVKTS